MARTYWLYLLGTCCSIELLKAHIKNLNKLVKFKQNSPTFSSSSVKFRGGIRTFGRSGGTGGEILVEMESINIKEFFRERWRERELSCTSRNSHLQMFFKTGVLKNLAIFTEKHLCWSLFLAKLQACKSVASGGCF